MEAEGDSDEDLQRLEAELKEMEEDLEIKPENLSEGEAEMSSEGEEGQHQIGERLEICRRSRKINFFPCVHCEARFPTAGRLTRHLRTLHNLSTDSIKLWKKIRF